MSQKEIAAEAERDEADADGLGDRQWPPQRVDLRAMREALFRRHPLTLGGLLCQQMRRRKRAADAPLFQIVAHGRNPDEQAGDPDPEKAAEVGREHRDDQPADRGERRKPFVEFAVHGRTSRRGVYAETIGPVARIYTGFSGGTFASHG